MNTVIFTSFFSAKSHPQLGDPHVLGIKSDGTVGSDFSYIEKWYNSVLSLGLQARIFYDNLPDELVKERATNKIQFIKVRNETGLSNNDYRFYCYQEYLERNSFDAVFMSDCSDVIVKKDPSELFALYPDKKIFACADGMTLMQFPYLQWHIGHSLADYERFHQNANKWVLINMGVLGMRYEDALTFLGQLNSLRSMIGGTANSDMWTGQTVLRYYWQEEDLQIGEKVCSRFKGYETERNDVFFVHK